jgi:hypothetical protein
MAEEEANLDARAALIPRKYAQYLEFQQSVPPVPNAAASAANEEPVRVQVHLQLAHCGVRTWP